MSAPKWIKHPERIPDGYMWESIEAHKKLKRENAMMRRFFTAKTWPERNKAYFIVKAKLPDLFKTKRRGSK